MFTTETVNAAARYAKRMGVELAALLAVIEIESAGKVFASVGGRNEPVIRWEGHYFDRRLSGTKRAQARAAGLADPTAGKIANPSSQAARWTLLNRAIEIDAQAALESVSWGLGQVMGAHWSWLGYATVDELVNTARSSVAGQIDLMVRYIEQAGLVDEIRRRDWAGFARGYNGANYAKHGYHTKLAAAYARHARIIPGTPTAPAAQDGLLRLGMQGAEVRELQTLLRRAGHALAVDGDFGPATRKAVQAFQSAEGLAVDGVAGPKTWAALDRYRQSNDEQPGAQVTIASIIVDAIWSLFK